MYPISGATQAYLADLSNTQTQIDRSQAEVSSGYKVQQPSDDPAAVTEILQIQAELGQNQQVQTNLGQVNSELGTADSALQSAVSAVQNAITLAAQGANSANTPDEQANILQEVQGLQQTLVGISQTTVNGRYIFSGDQDSGPAYQLDPTQPNGVQQLISSSATRQIVDANGTTISVAQTAQQIFDNPNGSVFAAIQGLVNALQSGNTTTIGQSADALKTASDVLNQGLAFYGEAEDRVTAATGLAQKFQTQETQSLSNIRDADIPTVAVQLSQAQLDQQAALSAEARIAQMPNLFSMLG